MVTSKNGIQFLASVRNRSSTISHPGQPTDSLRRFGRLDKYRLVEDSSPSAFSRALKLSWCYLISPKCAWKKTQSNTYPSKTNLVPEMVERPDAFLRIANVGELGESKAANVSVRRAMGDKADESIPFAGAGGSVDDGFALLDFSETGGILVQKFVVRGGVEAADVYIPIAMDPILKALLNGLGVARRSEHRRHGLGDWRVVLEESKEVFFKRLRSLRRHDLLRGRGRIARPENRNSRSAPALRRAAEKRSGWGGLRGRV